MIYADDSVLLASGKDLVGIEATLSSDLESLSDYLINNKLSLHFGKTQPIVFGIGTKRQIYKCTLSILYVMEMSWNQSQPSPI